MQKKRNGSERKRWLASRCLEPGFFAASWLFDLAAGVSFTFSVSRSVPVYSLLSITFSFCFISSFLLFRFAHLFSFFFLLFLSVSLSRPFILSPFFFFLAFCFNRFCFCHFVSLEFLVSFFRSYRCVHRDIAVWTSWRTFSPDWWSVVLLDYPIVSVPQFYFYSLVRLFDPCPSILFPFFLSPRPFFRFVQLSLRCFFFVSFLGFCVL